MLLKISYNKKYNRFWARQWKFIIIIIFSLKRKNGTNKVPQRIELQTFRASERIGARNPKVRGMIAHEDLEFSLFSTLMKRRKTSISINILVPK